MQKDICARRRSVYDFQPESFVSTAAIEQLIAEILIHCPSPFHRETARLVVLFGEESRAFWERTQEHYDGKIGEEHMRGYRNAAGTILYFIDLPSVRGLQGEFPKYADMFPVWAEHENAMLQVNLWNALAEAGYGASLQHYQPKIDEFVREAYTPGKDWKLIAQMPFGSIRSVPDPKVHRPAEERMIVLGGRKA